MFRETYNKELIYNEFKDFQVKKSYLDKIWDNTNINIYLYLLNNIKDKINYNIILQEHEWKFIISKLYFCKILCNRIRRKLKIAVPYSRGGRSEAQHNKIKKHNSTKT